MCICVLVIILGLRFYKANRELEKKHRKFLEEEEMSRLN